MVLAHRYLSSDYGIGSEAFEVESSDAVRLVGERLGSGQTALLFCHGFAGWNRKSSLIPDEEAWALYTLGTT